MKWAMGLKLDFCCGFHEFPTSEFGIQFVNFNPTSDDTSTIWTPSRRNPVMS